MSISPIDKEIRKVTLPRPGHADLAGIQKYGFDDIRNVLERSSARETTMRVALGTVCRKLLEDIGIFVGSHVTQIHHAKNTISYDPSISPVELNKKADASPVRCLDKKAEKEMITIIDDAKKAGDSVGGIFEVIATGLPYGLGSPMQWDRKLQAKITSMMMSVNAFKGIDKAVINELYKNAETIVLDIGDPITIKNEISSKIYIINDGQARVLCNLKGKRSTFEKLGKGDIIGLSSLLTVSGCEDIIAASKIELIAFSDESILNLYLKDDNFKDWCNSNIQKQEIQALAEKISDNLLNTQISFQERSNS